MGPREASADKSCRIGEMLSHGKMSSTSSRQLITFSVDPPVATSLSLQPTTQKTLPQEVLRKIKHLTMGAFLVIICVRKPFLRRYSIDGESIPKNHTAHDIPNSSNQSQRSARGRSSHEHCFGSTTSDSSNPGQKPNKLGHSC